MKNVYKLNTFSITIDITHQLYPPGWVVLATAISASNWSSFSLSPVTINFPFHSGCPELLVILMFFYTQFHVVFFLDGSETLQGNSVLSDDRDRADKRKRAMASILPESLNTVKLLLPIWLSNSAINPTSRTVVKLFCRGQRAKLWINWFG